MSRIYAIVIALAIFTIPQISSAQLNWSVTFTEGDFLLDERIEQDSNIYVVIQPSGSRISLSPEIGYPEVPICILNFALPEGVRPSSVSINTIDKRVIDTLDYLLHPVQTPVDTMQYPFVPPNAAYEDSIYPADENLVTVSNNVSFARGVGIATVVIAPMQYSPATGELFLCEYISFSIEYEGMSGPPPQYSFRSARVGRALSDYIHMLVENDADVDAVIPAIPEPPPQPPDGVAPDYMIITNEDMAASFEPLRVWKTQKGIPTRTVILEDDIYPYFDGVDNAEKIRNFIISQADLGLFYVLLGGNAEIIPVRYAYEFDINYDPGIPASSPCDLYYAELDRLSNPPRDWDRDLDGVYGEPNDDNPDLVADVMVGRVPATSPDSVAVFNAVLF